MALRAVIGLQGYGADEEYTGGAELCFLISVTAVPVAVDIAVLAIHRILYRPLGSSSTGGRSTIRRPHVP